MVNSRTLWQISGELLDEDNVMRRMILISAALVAGLAACSDEVKLTMDDFMSRYPAAYCSYLIACCDQAERSYGSEAACKTVVEDQVSDLLAFREADEAHATFEPQAATDCLEILESKSCTEDPTLADGCLDRVTRPSQQAGDDCTYSAECSSYYCIQPQKNTLGYCGSEGAGQCSGDDRSCGEGSYCSSANQCTPKIADSATCGRGNECLSGICSPSAKICVPRQTPYCDGK